MWLGVTAHPTAEWIARQVSEACGWDPAPTYLVRDRDRVYGECPCRKLDPDIMVVQSAEDRQRENATYRLDRPR